METYLLNTAGFRKKALCLSSRFLVCELLQLDCPWAQKLVLWVASDATMREAIAKTEMSKKQGITGRILHSETHPEVNLSWTGKALVQYKGSNTL